jgi:hypothetical protein
LKYNGNKPSPPRRARSLGEIVNPAVISTYFTEPVTTGISLYYFTKRSGVYFNYISIAFPFNYFTERSAVYFYPISIVFLLRQPAAAGTFYNPNDSFPYTGGSYLLQKI